MRGRIVNLPHFGSQNKLLLAGLEPRAQLVLIGGKTTNPPSPAGGLVVITTYQPMLHNSRKKN
jgi:hypothetical protein